LNLTGYIQGDPDYVDIPESCERPDLVLTNRGLLLFALDKPLDAAKYFTILITLRPESSTAINNLAICYLYAGNVVQASSFLESFLVSNPHLGGSCAELISNLASMYDLTDSSLAKKKALLKVIIQSCGDNFDPQCLKL
jgi:tetratricopeptide (TPR) repeat protein